MPHEHDYWEGIRRYIIPPLGKLVVGWNELTRQNLFVTNETRQNQFVGRVDMDAEDFEEVLHEMGFHRNPLASLKYRRGEIEEGSFRKVGFEDDPEMQLHAITYDGEKIRNCHSRYTYIYAHWEYRWDVGPLKHYRGVDFDARRGVLLMRKYLDDHGIQYDFIQPGG